MATKGVNKCILVGNLGQDPEVRYTPSGAAITNISIATSETWKDKNTGQMQDKTEWHRVVFFGKLAEIAGEYLKKGSQVYVEGKLRTRKWQNKEGADQYSTEIVVDGFSGVMQMLGGRQEGQPQRQTQRPMSQQAAPQQQHQPQQPAQRQVDPQYRPHQPAPNGDFDNTFDDDIPF